MNDLVKPNVAAQASATMPTMWFYSPANAVAFDGGFRPGMLK
jgi:hypothetical protein